MYVNPANPGVWTSLSQQVFGGSWVRMAPNNSDVVTGECYRFFQNSLVEIQPNGTRRSIAFFGGDYFSGFELDHEGRWILARQPYGTSSLFFHGVHHASGAVNTFFTCNYTWANDLAVGGEPGGPAFAVSATRCDSTKCTWGLVQHDRRGAHQWLPVSPAGWGGAIEIHPRSGDYFLAYYLETNASTARVARVSRTGRVTLLHSFPGTAARITQDDHAWISGPSHLLKYDISGNAVVTLIPAPQYHSFGTGIEVYGSRRLVCEGTGKPGTSVKVTLQSRKAGDGNRAYILACSLGRRPGMRFSSGEWLDLDVTDALFRLSASWAVPALFQNFRGEKLAVP